jgi:hypothetical protein
MQIQMLAVLYGKEVELLTSIQYLGYLPPLVVGKDLLRCKNSMSKKRDHFRY